MEPSLNKKENCNTNGFSKIAMSLADAATQAFLTGSVDHCQIGVQLLAQLTAEMNQISESDASISLIQHQNIVSLFRDTKLYSTFKLSCTLLRTALENSKTLNFSDESLHELMTHLLHFALKCLTFDDMWTKKYAFSVVQIPHSWTPAFLDFSIIHLFFDLYASLPATLSSITLSCLVQIVCVRENIFCYEERVEFLSQLVNGVRNVLQNPQNLSDPSNYYEFCLLLLRLKRNYHLGELTEVEHYPDAIQHITKFTVESLNMHQIASKSITCLLAFWHSMVYSISLHVVTKPHLLETYTPEVVRAYVLSRLERVSVMLREGLEEPLDGDIVFRRHLELVFSIGRCEYGKTYELLVQLFEQTAQRYQELITARMNNKLQENSMEDIAILEGQLTRLVNMIEFSITMRTFISTSDDYDAMDGELVCRVLQLMNFTDSCLPQGTCERLELATISFFEQFRKTYVSSEVHETSKFYRRLSEILELNDESMILEVFVQKIKTNLKYWSHHKQILTKTLTLLSKFSINRRCAKKLVKLDAVQFMLNNHTSEHFPFLGVGVPVQEMRSRTLFYVSLGQLLMMELEEEEEKFTQFMIPITSAFDSVGQLLAHAETVFQAEEAKKGLISLARDLRGLAYAFNNKPFNMMLFDWIFPTYIGVLVQGVEIWCHDPQVTTPVLKLFAELAKNRALWLQSDLGSSKGIWLFQEIYKVFCTYGSYVLAQDVVNIPKDQIYPRRLKGISISFSMLKEALCGNFVHLRMLHLHGDDALDSALHTFVKLLLSIPQSDLLMYPKLSQIYYVLMECLTRDHMNFLSTLESNVFPYILSSIPEAFLAADKMAFGSCCATLDHIVSYLFETLHHKRKNDVVDLENNALIKIMKHQPSILQQMLATLLNIVMFKDRGNGNERSLSHPLLPLILLNNEYYGQLKQQIISQQAPDKQETMVKWFDNFMEEIESNLFRNNRDKFTKNLIVFRQRMENSRW